MGLIKCPDCKNKISSSAPTCPYCGRPMKGNNSKSSSINHNVGCSTYAFLAIIVMVFIGWTAGKSNDDAEEPIQVSRDASTNDVSVESASTKDASPVEDNSFTEISLPELYTNWENYKYQNVKVSGKISEVSETEFRIYGKTASGENEIKVIPKTMPGDIHAKEWVTVTGKASRDHILTLNAIEDADIVQTGADAKKAYKSLRNEYFKEHPEEIPPTPTSKPQAVSVDDSIILPALKLFDNYEQYNNQYVTISAPISYASENTVEIDNDAAGKFHVTLLESRSDLSEGDYMTVTGLVDGMSLGEVQIDNSNISATGDEPARLFEQGKQDYSNESGKIIEGVELSEQDFKARCREMWYEDIAFSDKNLEGEYVKVKLYIEDSGVINPKKYYDSQVMELIQKYHLDRTISMVGIYSKDTDSYGSSKDLGVLYSLNTGYSGSDFMPGTYITLYGKIINYSVNKWDGHNSAYFMPKYIERN